MDMGTENPGKDKQPIFKLGRGPANPAVFVRPSKRRLGIVKINSFFFKIQLQDRRILRFVLGAHQEAMRAFGQIG